MNRVLLGMLVTLGILVIGTLAIGGGMLIYPLVAGITGEHSPVPLFAALLWCIAVLMGAIIATIGP